MHVEMDVALDPTLGCGQAHRWKKQYQYFNVEFFVDKSESVHDITPHLKLYNKSIKL